MATKTAKPYSSNDIPPMATVRFNFVHKPFKKRQVRLADTVFEFDCTYILSAGVCCGKTACGTIFTSAIQDYKEDARNSLTF